MEHQKQTSIIAPPHGSEACFCLWTRNKVRTSHSEALHDRDSSLGSQSREPNTQPVSYTRHPNSKFIALEGTEIKQSPWLK